MLLPLFLAMLIIIEVAFDDGTGGMLASHHLPTTDEPTIIKAMIKLLFLLFIIIKWGNTHAAPAAASDFSRSGNPLRKLCAHIRTRSHTLEKATS